MIYSSGCFVSITSEYVIQSLSRLHFKLYTAQLLECRLDFISISVTARHNGGGVLDEIIHIADIMRPQSMAGNS